MCSGQKILNVDSAIHTVVRNFDGDLGPINILLEQDATDINVHNLEGKAPVHLALENTKCTVGLLSSLWKKGADFNVADINGNTPLHFAARNNKLSCTIRCRHDGRCFIGMLVKHHSTVHKSDVNARNFEGDTPLHFAAQNERYNSPFYALLAFGADINARNFQGNTVFHTYLQNNKEITLSCLMTFLKKIKDISAPNCKGETPLHLAVRNKAACKMTFIKKFLVFGADPEKKDALGENAYEAYCHAADKDNRRTDHMLKIILQPKKLEHYISSSLHVACLYHDVDSIDKLLRISTDVNANDEFNHPPLFYALTAVSDKFAEKCASVRLLLDYGANINSQLNGSHIPIHFRVHREEHSSIILNLVFFGIPENQQEFATWKIFFEHMTKLAALRKKRNEVEGIEPLLPCANVNNDNDRIGHSRSGRQYEYWFACYSEELKTMSEIELGDSKLTCLDLLLASPTETRIYAKNKPLVLAYQENKAKFPMYQGMMEAKFGRELERRKLIESASVVFSNALKFADPSDEFFEKTFSYCSNKDLMNVIAIGEVKEKIESMNVFNRMCSYLFYYICYFFCKNT